jgi:hypothetical protein
MESLFWRIWHDEYLLQSILRWNRPAETRDSGDIAASIGYLMALEKQYYTLYISENALPLATRAGKLDVVKWLLANRSLKWNYRHTAFVAAYRGHLHILEWLYTEIPSIKDVDTLSMAASAGRLHIIQWLHIHHPTLFGPKTMDIACYNGYLEVVRWLCDNRREGCSASGMDSALILSSPEIAELLWERYRQRCTNDALNMVIVSNRMWAFRWILDHLQDLPSFSYIDAVDRCIMHDRVEMLRLVYPLCDPQFEDYRRILVGVASLGGKEMIDWLWEKRFRYTEDEIDFAKDMMDMALELRENS